MSGLLGLYLSTFAKLAPLLACAGVGFVWARREQPFAGTFVTMLVTAVATPALVFHTLVTAKLDSQMIIEIFIASFVGLMLVGLLCLVGLRMMKLPVRSFFQTAWIPNAGNLGIPVSQIAFGDAGLPVAVAFFAVSTFLTHTVGVKILTGSSAGRAWKNPGLLARVLAVLVRTIDLSLPVWVLSSFQLVGSITVPLMLLSLGYSLFQIPRSGLRTGAAITAVRFVAGWIAGAMVFHLSGLDPLLAGVISLQLSMPCAVASYMFAARYSDRGNDSAGAVLISTVLFVAAAPLMFWLASGGGW